MEVNGPGESPIFRFLKEQVPNPDGSSAAITWNFSKFLVNRRGQPVKHYGSAFEEAQLQTDIEKELGPPEAFVQS